MTRSFLVQFAVNHCHLGKVSIPLRDIIYQFIKIAVSGLLSRKAVKALLLSTAFSKRKAKECSLKPQKNNEKKSHKFRIALIPTPARSSKTLAIALVVPFIFVVKHYDNKCFLTNDQMITNLAKFTPLFVVAEELLRLVSFFPLSVNFIRLRS